ncbi:MAG TPA: hypothetical protein VGR28_15360 [Candidatus Thermoplasmatota archaeon]|jgi:hypothetical protein|nr:hypothetical protein [Candidatus Thermoplasmatota archaeon]
MLRRGGAWALAVSMVVAGPLGLAGAGGAETPLGHVVEVAHADLAQQAQRAGVVLPGLALPAMDAQQGATLVAARWGATLQAADLAALGALPADLDAALGQAFAAYLAMDAAARVHDVAGVLAARGALLDAALVLDALRIGVPPLQVATPPALALDLGGVDSAYPADLAFVLDFGGRDVYTNNAGGSRVLTGLEVDSCIANFPPAAAALIDLGSGDDAYVDGHGCGVNGGGVSGAGFLLDAGGNDHYVAVHDGTNGGGARLGLGFLLDAAGDDVYEAGGWGTNGGAYPGSMGSLLDGAGNDLYLADLDGVNGGAREGIGFLHDLGGDDGYQARYAASANGGASFGIGALIDDGGHDWYAERDAFAWDASIMPKGDWGAQLDR